MGSRSRSNGQTNTRQTPKTTRKKHESSINKQNNKRFSAFSAKIKRFDNLTIEVLYQCTDLGKGNDPIGLDWRKGKGLPPANRKSPEELYKGYKQLWTFWMAENIDLVFELAERAADAGYVLTDCFASTPVNQARALSELLNEFFGL